MRQLAVMRGDIAAGGGILTEKGKTASGIAAARTGARQPTLEVSVDMTVSDVV